MADRTASDVRRHLQRPGTAPPGRFDPATITTLPPAARRFLGRAIPDGTPLVEWAELAMAGSIRLGRRWFPFTARQVLRAGEGFVWEPRVGGRFLRFVGADLLGPDGARTEFRFHGVVPVVRAAGADVDRSAAGRLAAETVAWLPQALTPQLGASWVHADDRRATVAVPVPAGSVDVEIEIDDRGDLRALRLERWNTESVPPGPRAFGARIDESFVTDLGVRIAGGGRVAWDPDRPTRGGEFFRYRVTRARGPAA